MTFSLSHSFLNKTTNKSFLWIISSFFLLNYEKLHLLSEIETQTKRNFLQDYYYSLLGNVFYIWSFSTLCLYQLTENLYSNSPSVIWRHCKPYCKTRYVSIFPLYVKAFGLNKIEQNEKEKVYLNILGFHIFDEEKLVQDKRIKVDRRQMKSSRTWT